MSAELPTCVPLFPLPDAVLIPGQVLALHVFEPRYRLMTADALAGAGFIAVTLLKPGFEPAYFTAAAPIHDVIGVGRIVTSQQLGDGRFNILLRGVGRARITTESHERAYRVARIERLHDLPVPPDAADDARDALRRAVSEAFADCPATRDSLVECCDGASSLGECVDRIAGAFPAPGDVRQRVLEELDPASRAALVIDSMRTVTALSQRARDRLRARHVQLN